MLLALFTFACGRPSQSERCDDLAEWLDGYERNLPIDCGVDTDCQVAYLNQGRPVAVARTSNDERLRRVVRTLEGECGRTPSVIGEPVAVCEPLMLDQIVEGQVVGEEEVGRACVLRGDFIIPERDAGFGGSGDALDSCSCQSNADCVEGRCIDCACVPPGRCGDLCVELGRCDALDALQLGSDAGACARQCEGALDGSGPEFGPFVECLEGVSECGAYEECLPLLPPP